MRAVDPARDVEVKAVFPEPLVMAGSRLDIPDIPESCGVSLPDSLRRIALFCAGAGGGCREGGRFDEFWTAPSRSRGGVGKGFLCIALDDSPETEGGMVARFVGVLRGGSLLAEVLRLDAELDCESSL